ncbi:MAG TPA: hypothetical protein VFV67_11945 [Actinophytocola sp.]|uniref:hypothetical protein n=1 Tax=Actinophytocola sp. TaxID=1872138 RepID=UPI002DB97F8A|nr:hypothetical protein [Actinophytocola sp.]HEU5471358.1 hypothetical protein [Actinophytocola sp.]
MWHTTFIAAHAVTGVVALVTGLTTMRRGRLFDVYLGSLVGMTVFLLLAIGAEWNTIGPDERVLFTAFGGLAGIMVWRAVLARRERPRAGTLPSAGYLGHVGFTVVALFDAFSVVTVLNAGAPVWAVVGTGVVIAVAGHFALGWAKHGGMRRWSTS